MHSRKLMLANVERARTALGTRTVKSLRGGTTLEGTWTAAQAEQNGREAAQITGHVLRFEEDAFRSQENGATIYEGTFTVNRLANWAAIDFNHTGGTCQGHTWRGIFMVDGDLLTICDNAGDPPQSRPTSFAAQPDSGFVLVLFRRSEC